MVPAGLSLSDLKSNILKRDKLPGFENDCWRFLVDVSVLTAGSPYAEYITLNVFREYTRAIVSLYVRDNDATVEKVMTITGDGALSLAIVLTISLLLLYKSSRKLQRECRTPQFDEVWSQVENC